MTDDSELDRMRKWVEVQDKAVFFENKK